MVACYTKWDYVVEVVTLVIVHPVRGKVELEYLTVEVEAEAVTTIVTYLFLTWL